MSSGILFLTADDFEITKGSKGYMLTNFIKDFSLILFYSPQCPYSQQLLPIFKKLTFEPDLRKYKGFTR